MRETDSLGAKEICFLRFMPFDLRLTAPKFMDWFLGLDPIFSHSQRGILVKRSFISKGFYAVLIAVSSDCVLDSQAYLR